MLLRPRRWSDLSRVRRVELYTRYSLYLMLLGFCATLLIAAIPGTSGPGQQAALLAGGIAVTALGVVTMAAAIGTATAGGPFPWYLSTALLLTSATYLVGVGLTADREVEAAVALVVVINITSAVGALPDHRVTLGLIVGSGVAGGLVGGQPINVITGVLVAGFIIFTIRVSLWLYRIVAELDESRHAQAQLAVAEERLRFSRDVHDVLGRRLSTIAVQAELAATLAGRGDVHAVERMLEVRGIAHAALGEARELARGYRPTDLRTELEGARSLLRSAGIEVLLDTDVVPRGWHEAAGWIVRESVTNVLRHSAATRVRIDYADETMIVENDGVRGRPAADLADGLRGGLPGAGDASGLRGLRERLEPLGATMRVVAEGGRWTVLAHLPGAGPLSAATTSRATTPRAQR